MNGRSSNVLLNSTNEITRGMADFIGSGSGSGGLHREGVGRHGHGGVFSDLQAQLQIDS